MYAFGGRSGGGLRDDVRRRHDDGENYSRSEEEVDAEFLRWGIGRIIV